MENINISEDKKIDSGLQEEKLGHINRKKKFNRIKIFIFLFLIFVVLFFSLVVSMQENLKSDKSKSNKLKSDKFISISSCEELQNIRNNLKGEYKLIKDIDCSETLNWDEKRGFTPIGDEENPFMGVLDGQGFKIKGLSINRSKTSDVGLFGYTNRAKIINLNLEKGMINGYFAVGGIVGRSDQSLIDYSSFEGIINGADSVGGLIGSARNQSTISKSYSKGDISGQSNIGGLVGVNYLSKITNSFSLMDIRGDISSIDFMTMTQIIKEGLNGSNFGGLVGENSGSTINNSYFGGSINGHSGLGGLVARNDNESIIVDSFSFGKVTGSGSVIGGLVASNISGKVINSFWDIESSGQSQSDGGIGKTTSQMKDVNNFSEEGWNIGLKDMDLNNEYPYLYWQLGRRTISPPTWYIVKGESDPLEISNCKELQDIKNNIFQDYVLVKDIDCSETKNWNWNSEMGIYEGFEPIGDSKFPFSQKLDGQGFKIKGLYINRPNMNFVGLFSYANSSTIKDIGIENGIVNGEMTGGLVGYNYNSNIIRTYFTGEINGESAGGLVGWNNDSGIYYSYSSGIIVSEGRAGGIVGQNDSSVIYGSYSSANVNSERTAGGLVGLNGINSLINRSYAMGDVKGDSTVGGLVGINSRSKINNSYSIGRVAGRQDKGGLVGINYEGTVSGSFWDIESSGESKSDGGIGKTTSQMKDVNTFLSNKWDIEEVEGNLNNNYPFLSWQFKNESDVSWLINKKIDELSDRKTFKNDKYKYEVKYRTDGKFSLTPYGPDGEGADGYNVNFLWGDFIINIVSRRNGREDKTIDKLLEVRDFNNIENVLMTNIPNYAEEILVDNSKAYKWISKNEKGQKISAGALVFNGGDYFYQISTPIFCGDNPERICRPEFTEEREREFNIFLSSFKFIN